jgi:23S rRNA (cytidine1920-2'-O)/16S rRNA (cytidine1409-2'-O)-methyltransferase
VAARRRLDAELVRRRLVSSRTQAQQLIADGMVTVGGTMATKPATLVDPGAAIVVREPQEQPYASRAGHKLAGALDQLGLPVVGRTALDAGAAHGGFTDVLLRRGAARVVAVDVAYGQLDWRLRSDARVVLLERTNVRNLTPDDVGDPAPDLVVADLSFISLALVLPALRRVAAPGADFALMVKPQFEAGREAVGRGGVVRDPAAWRSAMTTVIDAGAGLTLGLAGACASPLPGPSGNVEFFVHLCSGATEAAADVLDRAVAQGERLRQPGGG